MNYSNQTIRFSDHLVSYYSQYSKLDKQYILPVHEIADFDIDQLCGLIMSDNDELAAEATSVDNANYAHSMLPALKNFLSNTTDREKQINFHIKWKDGIAGYLEPIINELLSDRLSYHNDMMRGEICAA